MWDDPHLSWAVSSRNEDTLKSNIICDIEIQVNNCKI